LQSDRNASLRVERVLAIAAAGLLFAGCAAPIEGSEPHDHVGRAIQPIVGGAASGSEHDAVVVLARFENGARVSLCTATLLAPNLVVTARHCVSATDAAAACDSAGNAVVGAALHGDRAPETLAVFTATAGVAPDTTTDALAKARGKKVVVDGATTICNHDLALLVLDRPVVGPTAPVRLAPPAATELLTAVGFGITEVGALPASRMARGGLSLVGAGPMAYPDDARYGVGDAEFLVGESACSGDSGSPTLASSGAVVGIASRAGNGQAKDPNNAASICLGVNAHAVYAQLGASTALVMNAFAEAGATPWLEGQPDPRAAKGPGPASASDPHGTSAPPSDAPTHVPSAAPLAVSADTSDRPPVCGCSASGEPTHGAVESAVGIVFGILLVLRLRRRLPGV
jgi:Trypsin